MYTVFPGTGDETETADSTRDQRMLMRLATQHAARVIPVDETLNRLRGTKSAAELDLIRRAVYITNVAQGEVMRSMEPGMNEFEIQALIEYVFRRHGAERPSFATIVGSGPNSTTLHYNTNDRFTQAGDMVVMDIGASYRGYAADVTRSVPVNGVFSPEQRAIYSIVLDAQKAAEALARPGATMEQLNAAASRVLATGLARLGLIESASATYACGGAGALGRCPQLRLFYMHGLGHGIGLDVHDPNNSPFVVGSAFTIEPGIYVRADALDYLPDTPENRALIGRLRPMVERYRNIGVRIEDDYFITASGAERISAGAPREIGEIEALMAQTGLGNRERRPEVVEWYRAFGTR
ncbi:MAG: M24 family metallopeptidase [Gemmatimonadetes bacterium]|nr:M24 family metallopeptidase [Gemmatimonadota bacterium]